MAVINKNKHIRMGNRDIAAFYTFKRKEARKGKNFNRLAPMIEDTLADDFIRHQSANRWPTEATKIKRAMLDEDDRRSKKNRLKDQPVRKRPEPLRFNLLEAALENSAAAVGKLLIASSLKIKRVKRYPGWVLQRTYNLKSRPIQIV